MTITEIIARLEELRAERGDVEVEILTDEGDAVDIDIHTEQMGDATILCFY